MADEKFIDVHSYDGKLKMILKESFTNEEKKILIKKLICECQRVESHIMLTQILIDMITQTQANYDNKNEIDATDILATILKKNYISLLPIIEEQLVDIYKLGQCAQGRTTRLIQLLKIFDQS